MWNKINELSRKGLSQSQIASVLGIHRDTVRRYQAMSEASFNEHLKKEAGRRKCRLAPYREFVVNELQELPSLSSPQVLDHLKEHFPDMPYVSERTVYNYVARIRQEEDLPKETVPIRQMHHVEECDYGEQAQVDYGEQHMHDSGGRLIKVYFFAMVLRRSRYKFIYLQNVPFTARTTVYAHHLAFRYFGGVPKRIVYDQDRKMLVRENYGDYVMTEEFASYVKQVGYEPVFCMAADPQSKGLVENVVKYVKGNFLKGRKYLGIESLNEQVLGWLERTGNAKPNASTRLVPSEEFKTECRHLLPYKMEMEEPENEAREYTVRKDNTLLYRSNFYSLPHGTYTGPGCKVLVVVNVDSNELEIHDRNDFCLIARHEICLLKGKSISKEGHATSTRRDMLESERMLREYLCQWNDESPLSKLLFGIRTDRPRYYAKTLKAMTGLLSGYGKETAGRIVEGLLERRIYNADTMAEYAARVVGQPVSGEPKAKPLPNGLNGSDVMPEKRSVAEYGSIINREG